MKKPTPSNFLRHELIGLEVKVVRDSNLYNELINGIVIDDTKNTLSIKTSDSEKIIAKDKAVFIFKLGKNLIEVEGKTLIGKPEDRIKKTNKRNW